MGRYDITTAEPPVYSSTTTVVVNALDCGMNLDFQAEYNRAVQSASRSDLTRELFAICVNRLDAMYCHNSSGDSVELTESVDKFFIQYDFDKSKTLSDVEFRMFCESRYGATRKLVIKFMRNSAQFWRETNARNLKRLDSKHVLHVLKSYTANEGDYRTEDENKDCAEFREHLKDLTINGMVLNPVFADESEKIHPDPFSLALVLPAADRNLTSIFLLERPDSVRMRLYMLDNAKALHHIHSMKIMHGGVKADNTVRVDGSMRLIDFDCSVFIAKGADTPTYAGIEFCTACMPPEMFVVLKSEKEIQDYREYWHDNPASNAKLNPKLEPQEVNTGGRWDTAVVRGYFYDTETWEPYKPELLPYELVEASAAIDVWSFGVLLFHMVSDDKKPLLPVTLDNDIERDVDIFTKAVTWTDASLREEIACRVNTDHAASSLLMDILRVDPKNRPTMAKILQHSYFKSETSGQALDENQKAIAETRDLLQRLSNQLDSVEIRTKRIENISDSVFNQIRKTEKALMRAVFEASE
eukprot:gene40686-50340_t